MKATFIGDIHSLAFYRLISIHTLVEFYVKKKKRHMCARSYVNAWKYKINAISGNNVGEISTTTRTTSKTRDGGIYLLF